MKRILFVLSGVIAALAASVGINATTVPTDMYVEPGTTSCVVSWVDDDNSAWNLRYRLFTGESDDPVLLNSLDGTVYTNQNYQAVTLSSPWSGNNVYGGYGALYFRNATHQSATTDGYIKFTIPAGYQNDIFTVNLTTASGQYGSGRFVVGSTQTTAVEYSMSANETHSWTVTGSAGDVITITSPENQYSPDIAMVAVYYVPTNEWTYVNNLTKMEYTIEGLEMATEYEVQVQAIGDNGTLSDWCRPDVFMTLDEEPFVPMVHILGDVDDQQWACDAGTKMTYDPETEIYTATVHVDADKTFGFTTEIDANGDMGGWNYVNLYRFGPVSNGLFELTEDRLGQQLPLSFEWDYFSDVHVLVGGDYEITVSLEDNYIIIGRTSVDVQIGDVNKDGKLSISDVTALISAILSNATTVETDHYSPAAADVNGDGRITISDVTALTNILLTSGGAS